MAPGEVGGQVVRACRAAAGQAGQGLEQAAAAGGGHGQPADGQRTAAVGARLAGQMVLDGQVGAAPGDGQVGPAARPRPGEPGVRLRPQAERALTERTADREHAGLHQQVDQQRELLAGQVELAGQEAQVANGHRPGPDQRKRPAVQTGADPLGGDDRPGRSGRRPVLPVSDRIERFHRRRRRPVREDQAAAEPERGLPGDHQLAVGDRQQQAVVEQPGGRLGVRVAGEAAVADPHHGDRAGGGEGLLQQPHRCVAGAGERPRHHLRVGEGGAHRPDQRGLARTAALLWPLPGLPGPRGVRGGAEVGGDAGELLGAHPDLGQLGHGRAETAGTAERRRQTGRPGDGAVATGQGDAQLGKGVEAGP
ncbi:MAG TPA: hypothetical protein VGR68_08635 [Actinomycetota bacterium]|nr:hypothetical protein [Actinomycetota bacterium]